MLEDRLAAIEASGGGSNIWREELASFLRTGSWIGGDRDGNPFVTADALHQAMRMQNAVAIGFFLQQLDQLGAELSISSFRVDTPRELRLLAEQSPDVSDHRKSEPYRLALSTIAARLKTTASSLGAGRSEPTLVGETPRYASAAELRSDLDTVDRALRDSRLGVVADGRLRALRRAVDCFGFHLANLDIRQNADVHERTVAELLEIAAPSTGYLSLSEEERVALLRRELTTQRPLISPFATYSDETLSEVAIFRTAAGMQAIYGQAAIPNSIISMASSPSDLLELALLLKESGLVTPDGRSTINIVPLFETIASLRHAGAIMDAAFQLP
jgi:phosphoenolpyruvate carboxylase